MKLQRFCASTQCPVLSDGKRSCVSKNLWARTDSDQPLRKFRFCTGHVRTPAGRIHRRILGQVPMSAMSTASLQLTPRQQMTAKACSSGCCHLAHKMGASPLQALTWSNSFLAYVRLCLVWRPLHRKSRPTLNVKKCAADNTCFPVGDTVPRCRLTHSRFLVTVASGGQ